MRVFCCRRNGEYRGDWLRSLLVGCNKARKATVSLRLCPFCITAKTHTRTHENTSFILVRRAAGPTASPPGQRDRK